MIEHDDGILAIDTLTAGLTDVTAGYLIPAARPALIECGPALTAGTVVDALTRLGLDADDLAFLVLTHVHLDHAGGAGHLAEAFPRATIVVSEHGARHLNDPQRLNASSRRVYGSLFDTVYGACVPVAQERLFAVGERGSLDLGSGRTLELLHTPGHAKHHLGVHDPDTGAIFSGDSVGVKLPGMDQVRPATPPADFHLEAALRSLARYRARSPERIYLAHFGPFDDASGLLDDAEEQLRAWAGAADRAYAHALQHGLDELAHVTDVLTARFGPEAMRTAPEDRARPVDGDPRASVDASLLDPRLRLLNDVRSNAAGLVRYLERRDAGTLTPLG